MTAETTSTRFRNDEWIAQCGFPTAANVLDYLATSATHWDPTCNNAVLRMQTQYNALETTQADLRAMVGVEYEVLGDGGADGQSIPGLLIIRKQRRHTPQSVEPLTCYYVLHGDVFEAPDLFKLLSRRLVGFSCLLVRGRCHY
jgi:mediator of RNA polymerase II transcription subunit 6